MNPLRDLFDLSYVNRLRLTVGGLLRLIWQIALLIVMAGSGIIWWYGRTASAVPVFVLLGAAVLLAASYVESFIYMRNQPHDTAPDGKQSFEQQARWGGFLDMLFWFIR